jgi:uncharacterized protein (DUF1786 family)
MKILTVDIGTGTQDIFLYDSQLHIENGFKLIVPSPTMIVHWQVKAATKARHPILLTGMMMGGGPSAWAVEAHSRAGLKTFATTSAAKTLNDELDKVRALGIEIVSEDEATTLSDSVQRIEFRDFDLPAIKRALSTFGIDLSDLAAIAVAVFDHGDAPAGISDRQFRFDYLNQRIQAKNSLSSFAFLADNIPPIMTRLQSVAQSAGELECPLVVMDTAPAAVLGASFDPVVSQHNQKIIVNIGNFHTLAFRLGQNGDIPGMGIEGIFEHHTGEINLPKLETLLRALADGYLKNEDVFGDMGHGALMYSQEKFEFGKDGFDVVVTGPRRSMYNDHSTLRPYFAAPFGDMMIAGCFGLLAATAKVLPDLAEAVSRSMQDAGLGRPPWEI